MPPRKTEADYHALAASRGFRWIGEELPIITCTKTKWRCAHGHEWGARYQDIKAGYGCPYCAGNARKTEADYHTLAAERGFKWIGEELPIAVHTKTLWCCGSGHVWSALYYSVNQGSGCPHCANRIRKIEADYRALAVKRGFEWIGETLPRDTGKSSYWKCSEGHKWRATYSDINQGTSCPYCSGNIPKTAEDYHALATKRGFEWIGEFPANSKAKTLWRCSQGHEWNASYSNVEQYNCPRCVNMVNGVPVSKPQLALHAQIGGEVNYPVKRYRVDIALLDPVKIAVEYDCWYWHAGKEAHERKRDTYLLQHGWRILRIRSRYLVPTPEQLDEALARLRAGEVLITITLDDWKGGE